MIGNSIEDSIKNRLIIPGEASRMFFALKAANVNPPKVSPDALDIMKIAGELCREVLVTDYAVYKKWVNE